MNTPFDHPCLRRPSLTDPGQSLLHLGMAAENIPRAQPQALKRQNNISAELLLDSSRAGDDVFNQMVKGIASYWVTATSRTNRLNAGEVRCRVVAHCAETVSPANRK